MNRNLKNIVLGAFIVGVFLLLWKGNLMNAPQPKQVQYSTAWKMISENRIASGDLDKDQFNFVSKKGDKYFTDLDPLAAEERAKFHTLLRTHNIKYGVKRPMISDTIMSIIFTVLLPLGFLVVLWMLFMRQAQAGGNQALSFGRSKAKRLNENVPKVTFQDVAGVEEAKQELEEIVEFFKKPKKVSGTWRKNTKRRTAAWSTWMR